MNKTSVLTKEKMNIKKLWSFRGHLKIEAATFFIMLPGFLMMICMPIFELEKVNFDTFTFSLSISFKFFDRTLVTIQTHTYHQAL